VANTKSAEKRALQSEKRRLRNKAVKSRIKSTVKGFETAIEAKDLDEARKQMVTAVRVLDKAASKGVIHPNAADRRKSRLMNKLNNAANQ